MILGIDPGFAKCGWSVVDSAGRVVELGVVVTEQNRRIPSSSEDRARRTLVVAQALIAKAISHSVKTIAAEAMSFPPKANVEGVAAGTLPWGVLIGIAASIGARLGHVTPKDWQHAVFPHLGTKAVDYALLERELEAYVRRGSAGTYLDEIPRSLRTHALDAAAVGVFAAVAPSMTCLTDEPRLLSTPRARRRRRSKSKQASLTLENGAKSSF